MCPNFLLQRSSDIICDPALTGQSGELLTLFGKEISPQPSSKLPILYPDIIPLSSEFSGWGTGLHSISPTQNLISFEQGSMELNIGSLMLQVIFGCKCPRYEHNVPTNQHLGDQGGWIYQLLGGCQHHLTNGTRSFPHAYSPHMSHKNPELG